MYRRWALITTAKNSQEIRARIRNVNVILEQYVSKPGFHSFAKAP